MSKQYLVTTPKNPQYSGKTCGVRFENGQALVSEYTIDHHLGRTVEEVVQRLKSDFGYEVKRVGAHDFGFDTPPIVIEETHANYAPDVLIKGEEVTGPDVNPGAHRVVIVHGKHAGEYDDIRDNADPVKTAEVENIILPKLRKPKKRGKAGAKAPEENTNG